MKHLVLNGLFSITLMIIGFLLYWFITLDIDIVNMTQKERGGLVFMELSIFVISLPVYQLIKVSISD